MMQRLWRWGLLAALPAIGLAWWVSLSAAQPQERVESPAAKVRKALDQRVNLDFRELPLTEVLDKLREQTQLNFVLGENAAEPGIGPITFKQQNVPLRLALNSMLRSQHFGYAIIGDKVVIDSVPDLIHQQMAQPVDVSLDGVPLNAALKQLARDTATNLVLDPRAVKAAETGLTLHLESVPLETAVRIMAELAGLSQVLLDNVLFVTTESQVARLLGELLGSSQLQFSTGFGVGGGGVPGGGGLGGGLGGFGGFPGGGFGVGGFGGIGGGLGMPSYPGKFSPLGGSERMPAPKKPAPQEHDN
jgi:hypothetical protein